MTLRPLAELLSPDDPAWPELHTWFTQATNNVEVLKTSRDEGESAIARLQVTTRSVLGALGLETGGVLVDDGWLRLLGAGCDRMRGSLVTWNGLGDRLEVPVLRKAFVVAHDVLGGFFALDGGRFGGPHGNLWYFSPDNLEWEEIGLGFVDFVRWAVSGDVATFYADMRWPGWELDIGNLSGDLGLVLDPPPWTREGRDGAKVSRTIQPMTDLWQRQLDAPVS